MKQLWTKVFYALLQCSATPGATRTRPFWPWASCFTGTTIYKPPKSNSNIQIGTTKTCFRRLDAESLPRFRFDYFNNVLYFFGRDLSSSNSRTLSCTSTCRSCWARMWSRTRGTSPTSIPESRTFFKVPHSGKTSSPGWFSWRDAICI